MSSIESKCKKSQVNTIVTQQLSKLKYQYNSILSEQIAFNLLRARQRYFESGDKPGKMLASYIKQKQSASLKGRL